MQRSRIDAAIDEARRRFRDAGIVLPDFAGWSPADWRDHRADVDEILRRGLGWDVTDFGSGDFDHVGLTLFTQRNGTLEERDAGTGQLYAEKTMWVRPGQVTPLHFHWRKTEDIINRAGGRLVVQVYPSASDESRTDGTVSLLLDGRWRRVEAGETFLLEPGQGVQMPTRVYHSFWADRAGAGVVAGEVSCVNDDHADNRFLDPVPRHPEITEDVPARNWCVGELAARLRGDGGRSR